MNLIMCGPAMFFLGIGVMNLCFLLIKAMEVKPWMEYILL